MCHYLSRLFVSPVVCVRPTLTFAPPPPVCLHFKIESYIKTPFHILYLIRLGFFLPYIKMKTICGRIIQITEQLQTILNILVYLLRNEDR